MYPGSPSKQRYHTVWSLKNCFVSRVARYHLCLQPLKYFVTWWQNPIKFTSASKTMAEGTCLGFVPIRTGVYAIAILQATFLTLSFFELCIFVWKMALILLYSENLYAGSVHGPQSGISNQRRPWGTGHGFLPVLHHPLCGSTSCCPPHCWTQVCRYTWPFYLYFTIHCVGLLAAALLIAGLRCVDIPGHSTCTSPSTDWASLLWPNYNSLGQVERNSYSTWIP